MKGSLRGYELRFQGANLLGSVLPLQPGTILLTSISLRNRNITSILALMRTAALLLSLWISFSASPAFSQESPSLTGRITDETGRPLALAEVTVRGARSTALSDGDGMYRLYGINRGQHVIEVRRVGFTPATQSIMIDAGVATSMSFTLRAAPVSLDTVTVRSTEQFRSPAMREFDERRARGKGRFFTEDEITRMNARVFTDILRRVPNLQIQRSGGNSRNETVRSGRVNSTSPCNTAYFVNGSPFPLTDDFTINHFVSPRDVIGLEVYSGTSEIPPQFESAALGSKCGVIVIWTREHV